MHDVLNLEMRELLGLLQQLLEVDSLDQFHNDVAVHGSHESLPDSYNVLMAQLPRDSKLLLVLLGLPVAFHSPISMSKEIFHFVDL